MKERRKPLQFYTGEFTLLVAEPSFYEYALEDATLSQICETILDIAKVLLDRIRAIGEIEVTITMHRIRRLMKMTMYAWELKDRWALVQAYKAIQGI